MLAIKVDLRPAQRALGDIGGQVAFASALGLTQLAAGVQVVEVEEEAKTFDKATPFTKNAFAKKPATKRDLVATVFVKDIQAGYVAPYVVGGDRSLGGKKGMLVPIGARTNQYGNLTKGALARLKDKPGVFIGKVQTKRGLVSGVWQRTAAPRRTKGAPVPGTAKLKLLIEFEDTTPVAKHLNFYGRARAYVARNARPVMEQALATAMQPKRS
ncbi:hypothetical protein [uncultured Sphingomonas sp.]|uniref:hypothetical protein n=1 Tax=uncultured Sphingomonas sp. TaxID=158754 RepID=UPI0035CB04F6